MELWKAQQQGAALKAGEGASKLKAPNIVSGTATDFHNGLCSLEEINKTFIALIPKVQSPDSTGGTR
ncbi:unnamed protein product [Prunus armeniaca]|uniref:Uncharacterized protein n=1 Tax=Prunus armeniaca TaxID=36596 RepID=A0A6J5TT48_PRUAR|nr:unnamed protein product [Prunus armeniaca]CAB4297659.1 unnamed protein product [Prunus armeniaca]